MLGHRHARDQGTGGRHDREDAARLRRDHEVAGGGDGEAVEELRVGRLPNEPAAMRLTGFVSEPAPAT